MKINEMPDKISIPLLDKEEEEIVWTEATVLFVSEKLVPVIAESGTGNAEDFIVMCYTKDGTVHEVYLNTTKIISTRKYEESKAWAKLHPPKKRRTTAGKGNNRRDNNTGHKSGHEDKRESSPGRGRDKNSADGSEKG